MWNEYDDQSAQLPPPKLNRAKAFLGMGLPDRSSSRFVDGQPPADATNVTNPGSASSYDGPSSASSYDGPGYSDDYAVKAGGAAGSTTRLANRKTHGGLDPSLGSDQSERDYLRAQYDRSESDWRDQHPDMTMTNGAGQSFTMAQSRPRMRADAAMSQLQMLREKIAADASREHIRAGDTIAGNKSAAEIAALNATTAGTVATNDRAKVKADQEQKQYELEAKLRQAIADGKLSVEQAKNLHAAEMEKIAPTAQEETDLNNLTAIPLDLYKDDPTSKAAMLKALLKSRRVSPDISSALTAPRPGESVQRVQNGIENNFEAKASLDDLTKVATTAGNRSGLVNAASELQDWSNDVMGDNGSPTGRIGGMRGGQGGKIRSAFAGHVETLLKSRIATDRDSAIRATASSLLTKMPNETKAQQDARDYVKNMAKEMLQQESANSQQAPGAASGGAPPMPSGQEYRF